MTVSVTSYPYEGYHSIRRSGTAGDRNRLIPEDAQGKIRSWLNESLIWIYVIRQDRKECC